MRWLASCLLLGVLSGCLQQDTANVETAATPSAAPSVPSGNVPSSTEAPGEEEVVIDVRTREEWDTGHLSQAVHIPHTEIGDRIGEVTNDKGAKIVLYCRSGGRAGRAKTVLEEMGFTNVENAGGYEDVKDRFAD